MVSAFPQPPIPGARPAEGVQPQPPQWTPQTTASMQGWPQAIMSAKAGYRPQQQQTVRQAYRQLMRGY